MQSASATARSSCSPPTVTSATAGTRPPCARSHQVTPPHPPFPPGPLPGDTCLGCFFPAVFSSSGFALPTWGCFAWVSSVPYHLTVLSLALQGADTASDGSAFDLGYLLIALCVRMLRQFPSFLPSTLPQTRTVWGATGGGGMKEALLLSPQPLPTSRDTRQRYRHRVMVGWTLRASQAEGTVWAKALRWWSAGHVWAALGLEERPRRRQEMFRKHDGTRLWKDKKVLLLFWGTLEDFLSTLMNPTCTPRRGVKLYPTGCLAQGQAWGARPGRRLIPSKASSLRAPRQTAQPKPTSRMARSPQSVDGRVCGRGQAADRDACVACRVLPTE